MRILGNKPRDQLVIIHNKYTTIEGLTKIESVNLLIDASLKQEFIQWIKFQTIDNIAQQLKFSRSSAGRLKKALGLSETYTKDSRTTKWRRGQ